MAENMVVAEPYIQEDLNKSFTDFSLELKNPFSDYSYTYSYYRSHFFSVDTATCPLVQAAMPLILILARLENEVSCIEVSTLQGILIHEINAFSSQAHNQKYSLDTVVLNRYLLSATFDHFILNLNHDIALEWDKFLLVDALQNNYFLEKQIEFFSHTQNIIKIIENLLVQPEEHKDTLELIFLCLQFGFSEDYIFGTFSNGTMPVNKNILLEKVYPVLKEKRLLLTSMLNTPSREIPLLTHQQQKKKNLSNPLVIGGTLTIFILMGGYFLLNHIFHLMLQPLFNQLNTFN